MSENGILFLSTLAIFAAAYLIASRHRKKKLEELNLDIVKTRIVDEWRKPDGDSTLIFMVWWYDGTRSLEEVERGTDMYRLFLQNLEE